MTLRLFCLIKAPLLVIACLSGCSETPNGPSTEPNSKIDRNIPTQKSTSWHEKFNWKAEDYFTDPHVILLAHAIESNDLEKMDELLASRVNVNTIGKGNMTLLLWAFPDNKPERFKRLLEHGANPNVIFQSDFNTGQTASFPGSSVTYIACKTMFPKYFDYVFEHGGNPNLVNMSALHKEETPLFAVINGAAKNKNAMVDRLIQLGADLDHVSGMGTTPTMQAVRRFGQYNLALKLLEAGADYSIYETDQLFKLVHVVLRKKKKLRMTSPQQKKDYEDLVDWLEEHGESFEDAQADIERWASWSIHPRQKRALLRKKEIAERKSREQHPEKVTQESWRPKPETEIVHDTDKNSFLLRNAVPAE